ncbi:MAG: hypothetical protein ACE5I4_04630 [Thermoplasmata archaeon]
MAGADFVVREASEDDAEEVAIFIPGAWGEAEPGDEDVWAEVTGLNLEL